MNLLKNPPLLSLLFSLWLVFLPGHVGAGEKGQQAVQLHIGTILASNEGDEFDKKLSKMKNQLEVIKYRSYRLIKEESQKVPWHGNAAFEIPGGRTLMVMPREYRDNRLSLSVRLQEGEKPLLDTTVRIRNRGNFLLGGPAHEGGVLILSISAMTQ